MVQKRNRHDLDSALNLNEETKDYSASYRYLYKNSKPTGIMEIQHDLSLSSASVAEYHVKKLLSMGLVKQTEDSRYLVDAVVFENMIRIRRALIPIQIGYLAFFTTCLGIMLLILRPAVVSNDYIFGLVVVSMGCGIFAFEAVRTARASSI
jgi:hypothetical protein